MKISDQKSVVEWTADWLTEEFKQGLSPLPNLEDVTVATNQQSGQQ